MRLHRTRKHNRRIHAMEGLFTGNPVLSAALALPFVVAASYSLQAAACIIIGIAAVTLPMALIAALLRERLPLWVRVPLYAIGAALLLLPVYSWLSEVFPVVMNSLGVYFPIIAVNTLMMYRCEKAARDTFPHALKDVVLHLAGFTAVMLLAALLREVFGNGTLWGMPLPFITFKLGGLLIPFAGCILAAFLAAGAKYIGRLWRANIYHKDLRYADQEEEMDEPAAALERQPVSR